MSMWSSVKTLLDACWHHVTPTFNMDMPNGSSLGLGLGFAIFELDQEGEAFILFDFNC